MMEVRDSMNRRSRCGTGGRIGALLVVCSGLLLAGCGGAGAGPAAVAVDEAATEPGSDTVLSIAAIEPCGLPGFSAPTLCARGRADSAIAHARHLILLDESGSMRGERWASAIDAIAARRAALSNPDSLELILFAGSTTHLGRVTDAVLEDLRRRQPRGAHTDLGGAAQAAVDAIVNRLGDAPLFISFLTDGEQDPEPGSPFDRTCQGEAWGAEIDRAKHATAGRSTLIDFVRIGDHADVTCLRRVFPTARVCEAGTANGVRGCVAQSAVHMATSYLRWRFDQDTARAAGALTSAEPIRTTNRKPAPAELRGTSARTLVDTCWADAEATLPDGSTVTLNGCLPAGAETVGGGAMEASESDANGATRLEAVLVNGEGRWYDPALPTGFRKREAGGETRVPARLEPADEIRALGLDPNRAGDGVAFELGVAAGGPVPLWGYIVVILLIGAGSVARWWAKRPPVPPVFKPTAKLRDLGLSRVLDLERHRGEVDPNRFELPMPGTRIEPAPQLVVEVRRRGSFRGLFSPKDVEVSVHPLDESEVRVGVAQGGRRPFRVDTVWSSIVVEPGAWIVWADDDARWDEPLDRSELNEFPGYQITKPH